MCFNISSLLPKKEKKEKSIEVCTGCSYSHLSPLLQAIADSQARPCRLLLLGVSFPLFFYVFFFFFFQFSILLLLFLWVFDFCWVGFVFWDFDCFHNVCGVEKWKVKKKKFYGFCLNLCFGVLNRWKNSWGFFQQQWIKYLFNEGRERRIIKYIFFSCTAINGCAL